MGSMFQDETVTVLCGLWFVGGDDAVAFANGENLVGFDGGEALDLLRGWPLDFDHVDGVGETEAEVEAEVALRHDAGAAVYFIHLNMLAGDDAGAGADGGAIALGADEFEFDPVLLVAAVVAQQGWKVVEVEDEHIHAAVVEVIAEGRAATGETLADAGAELGGDVLEFSIAEVFVDEAWVLEAFAEVVAIDFGVDVPVELDEVGPSVVVVVDESATPGDVAIVDADAGGEGDVGVCSVAVVVVEVAGVVDEVGFEDIEPAIAVVVGDGDAHACLLVSIVVVGASGHDGDVGECAVVVVLEEDAGLGVDGDVDVGPSIVVKVVGDGGDGVARAGLEDAAFFRDVGECAVAVVVEEEIGVGGEASWAAHDGDALPLAEVAHLDGGWFVGVERDVVADEEVEVSVAVVVEEGASRAPAALVGVEAGFARDVSECAVAVVVEEDVVSPETAEEVVPTVVVVVADADAGLPAGSGEAGVFGDIGERAVAIVFEEMGCGRLAFWPGGIEAIAVGEVDVEPAVVVVVEKCDAAAFGLDDGGFVIDAAPDVWESESGLLADVNELYAVRIGWGDSGLDAAASGPFPEWSGEHFRERATENEERGPEKATAGDVHSWH